MDKRHISALALTVVCFVAAPVAGYVYMFQYVGSGQELGAAFKGLALIAAIAVVGLISLIWVVRSTWGVIVAVDDQPLVPKNLPIDEGQCDTNSAPKSTAEDEKVRRPMAISRWQWGDIEAWAIVDKDVDALAARYRDTTKYEVVDALPSTQLPDGRWVIDIAVVFMYPQGAAAALSSQP